MDPPTEQEKFILPDSRRLYRTWCEHRNIVHGRIVQDIPEIRYHWALLSSFGLDDFLHIKEEVFEEAIKLRYAHLTVAEVPEGTETLLRSHLLGTLIKFSLSSLCEILNLRNEGDHVYLSAFDKLPAYGKSESESTLFSQ